MIYVSDAHPIKVIEDQKKIDKLPLGHYNISNQVVTNDGAFSFANEVPGVFENAKNAEGFVEITKLKPRHRTRVEANCCEECRMIVINY